MDSRLSQAIWFGSCCLSFLLEAGYSIPTSVIYRWPSTQGSIARETVGTSPSSKINSVAQLFISLIDLCS